MPRVLFTLAVTLARRSSVAGVGAVSLMAMMPSSASAVGTGSLGAVDATSAAAEAGNKRAQLALDIQKYEIRKYIGAFAAAMGGVDAVLFTGGIGENDENVRLGACEGLEYMGLKIDPKMNVEFSRQEHEISAPDSRVKVWIVPTNEELMIARDTLEIVSK